MSVFYQHLCAVIVCVLLLLMARMVYKSFKSQLQAIADDSDRDRSARRRPNRNGFQNELEPDEQVGFFRHWLSQFGDGFACLKVLLLRCTEVSRLTQWGIDMVIAAILSVVMCIFCTHTEGGSDLYMTTFIPILLFVLGAMFLFSETVGGTRTVSLPCALLILCGVALSVLLYLSPMAAYKSYHIEHPRKVVTFSLISVYTAIFLFPFLRAVCRSERRTSASVILKLLLCALYLVVLIFGKEYNNAKSWLDLGPVQFQVSEVTKTLAFALMGLELTNTKFRPAVRCTCATVTLLINVLALALMNEFGTLVVVGVVYIVLSLIYLPKLRSLYIAIVLLAILAVTGLLICRSWYYIENPVVEEPSETQVQEAQVQQTEATVPTVAEDSAEAGEEAPEKSLKEKVIHKGSLIYEKFIDRFNVMIGSEEVDKDAEGFQVGQAKIALIISSWGPSRYEVTIPEAKSDFIFVYLLLRMGIVFGYVVLLSMLLMLCVGMRRCLANPLTGEASVAVAFLTGLVSQSLIGAASSTGNFITIGIPFAFIAYGGSTTMMNYIMLLFILYASRTEALTRPENKIRQRQKPSREEV